MYVCLEFSYNMCWRRTDAEEFYVVNRTKRTSSSLPFRNRGLSLRAVGGRFEGRFMARIRRRIIYDFLRNVSKLLGLQYTFQHICG